MPRVHYSIDRFTRYVNQGQWEGKKTRTSHLKIIAAFNLVKSGALKNPGGQLLVYTFRPDFDICNGLPELEVLNT